MNKHPGGRPKTRSSSVPKYFQLPTYMARKLETYPNQTDVIIKALENYFEIDGKSKEWIRKKIQEIDNQKTQLLSLLNEEEKREQEEILLAEKKQETWKVLEELFEEYTALGRSIDNPTGQDLEWIKARFYKNDIKDVSLENFIKHFREVKHE